jgi:hypothetical protein
MSSKCAAATPEASVRTTVPTQINLPGAIDAMGTGVEKITSMAWPRSTAAGANSTPDSLMLTTRPWSHASLPTARYVMGILKTSRRARGGSTAHMTAHSERNPQRCATSNGAVVVDLSES